MSNLKLVGLLMLIISYGCIARKANLEDNLQPKKTDQGKFRLLTYNVLTGFQKNSSQVNRFVGWVRDKKFDVIAFQEMSNFTQDSLQRFAKRYGHGYAVLLKGNHSPIAITSKFPIANVKKMVDSMHHGCIYAKVKDFNIFITHLSPFSYQKCIQEMRDILKLATLISERKKIIILGDFNSFSPIDSAYYQQKNRYAVVQSLINNDFVDTYMKLNNKFESSFPTEKYSQKVKKPTRIDFVFANQRAIKNLTAASFIKDSVTNNLSDHYPLMTEFAN